MDEKTPHMHLCFVPLTEDGRLCAKEILGNKKKLTLWQDSFWSHMVGKYPDLERGKIASLTGRSHIPPRIFKEMTRLTKQRQRLEALLTGITPFNAKSTSKQISRILDQYIPAVEPMHTNLKKYSTSIRENAVKVSRLKEKNEELRHSLADSLENSIQKRISDAKLRSEYQAALSLLQKIPEEILAQYVSRKIKHPNQGGKHQMTNLPTVLKTRELADFLHISRTNAYKAFFISQK